MRDSCGSYLYGLPLPLLPLLPLLLGSAVAPAVEVGVLAPAEGGVERPLPRPALLSAHGQGVRCDEGEGHFWTGRVGRGGGSGGGAAGASLTVV